MEGHELQLKAAPGYIVGVPREPEEKTAGGIVLPGGADRLPIVKVLHDGGPPHGACEDCELTRSNRERGFWIEEGQEVVVAGVAQMLSFGHERLVLVPYPAIVARVLWMPKGV